MNKILCRLVTVSWLSLFWPAQAAEWYVSPEGSDAQPGTRQKPFLTLEAARDAARKTGGDKTIYLRGGRYARTQTLKLEPRDSGVIWRAYDREQPVLSGSAALTNFTAYKGSILKAPAVPGVYFRQLFFEDRRQILARYPNFDSANPYAGGWAYVEGPLPPMYKDIPGESNRILTFKPEDARSWARPEEGEVFIFARYNWWNNIVPVQSVDAAERKITLSKDCSYAIRPRDRYFVQNHLEDLDAPGEWYLDKQDWTLYFWPPSDLAGKAVYAPILRTLVELAPGTVGVTLQGLTLEGCEGSAIGLNKTTNCLVAGCTVRHVGNYQWNGINVSGGASNGVAGCDLYDLGASGISLSGGDRITLTGCGNYADNNVIHDMGTYYKQGVGINLNGCGLRASHNLIYRGPRMGIIFGGNHIVVEYNHLHHLNYETEDTGAIYTGGRDWIGSRGSVIRYNYIHDMIGFGHDAKGVWQLPYFSWGIYLDDNTGGVDVIGNLVVRCSQSSLHLHNARDNLVENNVFVEGRLRQIECDGWTAKTALWTNNLPQMIKNYESVIRQPAWQSLRNIGIHPTNAILADGNIMANNVIRRNIIAYTNDQAGLYGYRNFSYDKNRFDSNLIWHAGQTLTLSLKKTPVTNQWAAWQEAGEDVHSVLADPLFNNVGRDDYRLKSDSPAFKLGFQALPLKNIGPYESKLRASWPVPQETP